MKQINFYLGLFIFTLLFSISCFAQTGYGKISGTIITDDEKAAEGVTVNVVGTDITAISNEFGKFNISKIAAGNYILRISLVAHADLDEPVSITAGNTARAIIQLSINAQNLGEVIVIGHKNSLNTQAASGSLRTQTPLIELPQNVQVITGKALANQQITSMSDGVLRNVSGAVRAEHWADLYTNIQMRGSQVQAFRNGFNVVASFWGPLTEDMSFVDRIEFVKGPAAFMLGTGDPSGLYNVVTKKPTGENKGEISLVVGSYDFYRGSLDVDRKLTNDGKLLFRLNGAVQKKGSFRPFEHNDRLAIAPVVSYALSDKTKFTLEYTYQKAKMSDVGSYYVFSPYGYATLPRNFTLTQPGVDPSKINDHAAFLTFQHNFNENWKLTAQASYFNYTQTGSNGWPAQVNANGTIIRNFGIWDAESEMKLGQLFINGNLSTGVIKHRILAGIDAGKKDYTADWNQYYNLDTDEDPFDPLHPDYGTPPLGLPVFDRSISLEQRAKDGGGLMGQEYVSGYLQDELGFFDNKLRLTLAGRYGYLKQYEWGGDPYQKTHFTPRAGVSFSIDANTALYAVYDQAFIPQAGKLRTGKSPQPITGNNKEIGFKKNWFDGKWNTTLSAYSMTKKNELTSDPEEPTVYSIVVGEKRIQGIDFDLRGEILTGFNAIMNYAYSTGKVTKVAEGVDMNVGDIVPGLTKHATNAWLSYALQNGRLKGFGINGGFTYLIDRAMEAYNPDVPDLNLPDYFKLDGGLFWQNKRVAITANVFNILDKYLFSGYYSDWGTEEKPLGVYQYQAEPPRSFRLSITYKF